MEKGIYIINGIYFLSITIHKEVTIKNKISR